MENLINRLKTDFPEFIFKTGPRFSWIPPRTVQIGPSEPQEALLLLHELGHATLGHTGFKTHVRRLKMENEAWEVARNLAKRYAVPWDEAFKEAQLDTYRNWLHAKSLCKTCGLTRYQTPNGKYHCPHCDTFML